MSDHLTHPCPCGSQLAYQDCCAPLHQGQPAASPEALMRSRYTAFALGLRDYLLQSWHSSTRPAAIEPTPDIHWKRLEVLDTHYKGEQGQVHFRATYMEGGQWACLEENSEFVQEQGGWRYLKGTPHWQTLRPERNNPCPCGSGRKFKKCCQP